MAQQIDTRRTIETLEKFLSLLNEYSEAIKNNQRPLRVTGPRNQQLISPEQALSQL